jgi:hypothetical protein
MNSNICQFVSDLSLFITQYPALGLLVRSIIIDSSKTLGLMTDMRLWSI